MQEDKKIYCFKCGTTEGTIIKHHTSYNPEVIVDCCRSCHSKIHIKLRKNDLCPYSREETSKMSKQSHHKNFLRKIDFFEAVFKNVGLYECLQYDLSSGNVNWTAYFKADHNKKLAYDIIP